MFINPVMIDPFLLLLLLLVVLRSTKNKTTRGFVRTMYVHTKGKKEEMALTCSFLRTQCLDSRSAKTEEEEEE